jgi:hypothetical protein
MSDVCRVYFEQLPSDSNLIFRTIPDSTRRLKRHFYAIPIAQGSIGFGFGEVTVTAFEMPLPPSRPIATIR